jgi:hypothetical protein
MKSQNENDEKNQKIMGNSDFQRGFNEKYESSIVTYGKERIFGKDEKTIGENGRFISLFYFSADFFF